MRPDVRLDSAVFQLTPTRTRCDLVVFANGKSEKIASGLLNPFLAHLRAAQDQIEKGGYSITLEPELRADSSWFTKDTVERFVRFVSTPEVLERVSTIESEILQIEKAISIQGNEGFGLSTVEDHHQGKPTDCSEVCKPTFDPDAEKAIVLYKGQSGSHTYPPDSNGCTAKQEENSKVQLLRVLESRKTVLRKEQGMAFARAAAAGFDMDHMAYLISFAECFGASRLMDACFRYMELWKEKHETGQWLEVEAAEAMSARSDFGFLNGSGIVLPEEAHKQKEYGEAWSAPDLGTENNGKADKRLPSDPQVPLGPHEYFQGQYQNPTFPQWSMHSQPGQPMFQPYPVQGMPYYQGYPGSGAYFHPPYPPMEDPRFNNPQRSGLKRHSMDSKDSNAESEYSEMGVYTTKSQDSAENDVSEFDKGDSQGRRLRKRHGRSGKKQSGVVVIRNINYITSKRHGTSGSESQSASDSGTEEDIEDLDDVAHKEKHTKPLNKKGHKHSSGNSAVNDSDVIHSQETDSGNWQAFQTFLLRAEEKTSPVSGDIFASEKQPPVKSKHNRTEGDPILLSKRDSDVAEEVRMMEFDLGNGKPSRAKLPSSNDEMLISSEGRGLRHSQLDPQFAEVEGARGGYRRNTTDDFMIHGRENKMGSMGSDPFPEHTYERPGDLENHFSHKVPDESFILPMRSGTQDQLGADIRTAIAMDSEFPSGKSRIEKPSVRAKVQLNYEPDDLTFIPERGMESAPIGYDPAIDYDTQVPVLDSVKVRNRVEDDIPVSTKEGSHKPDSSKKVKVPQNGLEKRRKDMLVRKGTSSKLNPSAEAQKRADKLRAFKADLQKTKKEQEEEEMKRLEALKRERQRRIAARSNPAAGQSPVTPKQKRASLPAKLSPSIYRGSKFSDSEPTSSSPLSKLPIRTSSVGSIDSQKITKTSSGRINGLSRSVSSLPDVKKESNGVKVEVKGVTIQAKRLGDPKDNSINRASSLKPAISGQVQKKLIPDEPQMKKISAIMQLDKTKSATLPELKIKTARAPAVTVQKSGSKEALQKGAGSRNSVTTESIRGKKTNGKSPKFSNIDNMPVTDPVIEKTVVMLENETVLVPVVHPAEEIIDIKDRPHGDNGTDKSCMNSEYQSIRAPPSPITADEIGYSNDSKDHLQYPEVLTGHSEDEARILSDSIGTEKPYQAPYARATSLEKPVQGSLDYEKSSVLNSAKATVGSERNLEAHMPDYANSCSVEHIQEMNEKHRNKESKGFRKLLKFGRKTHNSTSGDANQDSDGSTVDDGSVSVSSVDAPILKNLISQDDSYAGGTPPKVSRPFSLLSPFRSRTSEKKLAAS